MLLLLIYPNKLEQYINPVTWNNTETSDFLQEATACNHNKKLKIKKTKINKN